MRISAFGISFFQGLILLFSGFLLLIFLIILAIRPSPGGFIGLAIGLTVAGGFNWMYSKLYEIEIRGELIVASNLFISKSLEKSNYSGIDKTFASPFIFQIGTKDGRVFYFPPDISLFFEAFSSMESDYLLGQLRKRIKPMSA